MNDTVVFPPYRAVIFNFIKYNLTSDGAKQYIANSAKQNRKKAAPFQVNKSLMNKLQRNIKVGATSKVKNINNITNHVNKP